MVYLISHRRSYFSNVHGPPSTPRCSGACTEWQAQHPRRATPGTTQQCSASRASRPLTYPAHENAERGEPKTTGTYGRSEPVVFPACRFRRAAFGRCDRVHADPPLIPEQIPVLRDRWLGIQFGQVVAEARTVITAESIDLCVSFSVSFL